ncbi:MAG: sulfatase-like hydrolase/transferase [Bacilli bacterium]|nr:sulfatase-like hydrolase/transferase [Bacilli bacterium]
MKNKRINRYVVNFITIFSILFSVEMIFRAISELPLFELNVIRIMFGNLILSSIFAFFVSLFKYKVGKVVTFIICLVTSIYSWAQLGFNNFLGVYISLQNASQGAAVKDYVKDFFASFKGEYYLCFVPIFLFLLYLIIFSKRFNETRKLQFKDNLLFSLLIISLCCNVYYLSISNKYFENKYSTTSNKELFMHVSNQSQSIGAFGTSVFGILDFRTYLFGNAVEIDEDVEFVNDEVEDKEVNENTRYISDIAWQELIKNTTNEKYNKLNNYFINQPITDKNEYSGMFEGKNVIFILMESVNDIILEYPEYYPNFNKMATEGWNYTNNYSPRNACATLNNEFSGMTSLYSIHSLCTAKKYRNNSYPESVFGVFNNAGYTTFSSHNYTEAYYPRKSIHTNMGSQEYYGVQKLGIPYSNEYINWSGDDDFMEAILKIIDKKTENSDQPFMTWLTTVSSHQPYSVDSIQGNKYWSMTNKTNLPYDVRRFMSKVKILDDGLGILLEGLEERGILEDTVIVLYGDHYPYGISKDHLNKALSYNTSTDMNAEQVPLVIYNPTLEPRVIEDYTYYVNILPTVFNMMGVEYDPRLYMGTDMNSEDFESMVVFADGSWKNEYVYFNASTNKVKTYKEGLTDEDISKINSRINSKNKISELAISTNYFSYLEKNLTKIKEKLSEQTMCLDSDKQAYIDGTYQSDIKIEDATVEIFDGSDVEEG